MKRRAHLHKIGCHRISFSFAVLPLFFFYDGLNSRHGCTTRKAPNFIMMYIFFFYLIPIIQSGFNHQQKKNYYDRFQPSYVCSDPITSIMTYRGLLIGIFTDRPGDRDMGVSSMYLHLENTQWATRQINTIKHSTNYSKKKRLGRSRGISYNNRSLLDNQFYISIQTYVHIWQMIHTMNHRFSQ
jgi:hypothetical protein